MSLPYVIYVVRQVLIRNVYSYDHEQNVRHLRLVHLQLTMPQAR